MTSKETHRMNLLSYLGNPENDFVIRARYPEILGVTKKTIYKNFTPLELSEIESEAVEIRKKASSRQRANVLDALYARAMGYSHPDVHISNYMGEITITEITKHYPPDKAAGQEFLDRTEGKVPDKIDGNLNINQRIVIKRKTRDGDDD